MLSLQTNKSSVGGKIKRFFKETFRAHTRQEYKDFFVRSGDGEYKTYPFMWLRVLVLELIIFAIVLIVSEFTGYDTFWSYAVLTGGMLINIPLFILVYELYPSCDVGFLKYFIAFFVGGAVAIVLSLLVYYAYRPSNEWLSALWTGFVEEFFKAVPAIVFILVYRNKNPLFGFLIGAAVGAGVSVIEDMYYIHDSAGAWGFWGNNWQSLIEVSVGRGLSAGCTHTLWTALIGWAFCKFKKPLINFRFYLVAILCVALHFVWDLPLDIWWVSELVYIGCAVVGLAFVVVLLKKERAAVFGGGKVIQAEQLAVEEVAAADAVAVKSSAFGLSHIANIVAAVCLSVISVFIIGVCYSDWGFTSYQNIYFESIPELYDYVQDGLPIDADEILKREYDESVKFEENYAYAYENGERVSATQTVNETKGEYEFEYFYGYVFRYDEENDVRTPELDYVYMNVNGIKYRQHTLYNYNGDKLVYFTKEDPDIGYDDGKDQYYVTEYCDEYYDGLAGTVVVGSAIGLVLIGGIVAVTTLKIKARRLKND